MGFLTSLHLLNFRCYADTHIKNLSAGAVVLHGANGAGKTNILEAVSLLTPGRGMRGAKLNDIQKKNEGNAPWVVAAHAQTPFGAVQIGTGWDVDKDKRTVRINGAGGKAQSAMSEWLSCVWLTPQMDRLFLEASSSRRRFLDRLVFTFDTGHAGRVTRYDNAMSQRAKILKEYQKPDPAWLDGLEATMAETGTAIAAARLHFVQKLQEACDRAAPLEDRLFPKSRLAATGTVEELLTRAPALEVEDLFRYQLTRTRDQDSITGGAATGVHRSDLSVTYAAKNMPAAQCSTGEQKALLLGIILAHARLMTGERGSPPILLLDEVAAHLDETRRAGLYDLLLPLGGQVWLTGTDESLFFPLKNRGAFFHVEGAVLFPSNTAVLAA